eukprot:c2971_g1_i1.p1 GENE.c2971_g1_i1~~c2971_g1_i1.p1  ORF type:complete len:185 (+),score=57.87 c2971_g1_i1:21-575(+)
MELHKQSLKPVGKFTEYEETEIDDIDISTLGLTATQIEEFSKLFKEFDSDHSGSISYPELSTILRLLGKPAKPETIKRVLKDIDKNNDGVLSLGEFLLFMSKGIQKKTSKEELKSAFEHFDVDGDGMISVYDFKQFMLSLLEDDMTERHIDQMIMQACDGQYSEYIDINSFVQLMTASLDLSNE